MPGPAGDCGQGNIGYELALFKGHRIIHQETSDMLATILLSAPYCRDSREESASEEGYL